ncbi:extensin family protein [Rubellimicrobium roseum]|uniref:Extensin-like C-terminal domain-containing protein n=1 Tax=Rubellimicrobium roseum TaxID=687525 RepID=A0A5C4NKP9_9RHOB|nr:extensin family protein [Rubellimicrobium roseum]TNC74702.1 hypothetical protein FHG71_00755 [Rubellimicrobium roseum]
MRALLPPLLALLVGAGAVVAEAPESARRPEARAVAEPPARPEARSGEDGRPVVETRPDSSPAALAAPPELEVPDRTRPVPEPAEDVRPTVPRQPPLIETEPPPAVLDGPRNEVRAEELMTELPPVPVQFGFEGEAPPVRPLPEPRRAERPGAGRPRARPEPPLDPRPLLPPEPDAPPAYAPPVGPEVLPLGPEYSPLAVARSLLPSLRPEGIVERAEAAARALALGQVCGDPRLQGEVIAAIRGGGGCGVEEPVLVRSVDGVTLSTPATMDCVTAEALLEWIVEGARPAVGSRGGGLEGFEIMGSYSCRPRNNQAGARLSEHGRGRAVDIGAVILRDGSRLSVAGDWPDPALREMHDAACGIFSTTLGPGSDGFHEDHLHYDTTRGRGPYCR